MGIVPIDATAAAAETASPIVGSFAVDGATVDLDDRTGNATAVFPVLALPGLGGRGSASLSLSYSADNVRNGDVFGLGGRWSWGLTHVDVSHGGIRVFPAAGGVFDADRTAPSGLARYPQNDLVFEQQPGSREFTVAGGDYQCEYAFTLETMGGAREYFSAGGVLVARVDAFGNASVWDWDEATGSLLSVTDKAGNRAWLEWSESGVRINTPTRADGVLADALSITRDAVGVSGFSRASETTALSYNNDGLLSSVRSPAGAVTRVEYAERPATRTVTAITLHGESGEERLRRLWSPVGEKLFTGFPQITEGEAALWSSGDAGFRYQTVVSDGVTRVVSNYNSMGLLINRSLDVPTPSGTKTVQENSFVYPETRDGGVPTPNAVPPPNYAKPIEVTTTFRDDTRSRTVTERTEWDDLGRPIRHTDSLGGVTTTTYDELHAVGTSLPSGLVREEAYWRTTTAVLL